MVEAIKRISRADGGEFRGGWLQRKLTIYKMTKLKKKDIKTATKRCELQGRKTDVGNGDHKYSKSSTFQRVTR